MANALNVKIGGDVKELQSALNTASKAIQDTGKRMTDMGKTISTRVTAPLTALAGVAVRAFGIQEKAELQLRAALQANGREVDNLFNRYNAFAQEMQRVTVVGDETTLSMLAQAESFGLSADNAERAVKNSIAMQSAFGVNAQSALRYTAALEEGNATMLTRYIPSLREIDDESERVAEAQRILGNAFSSAEAEAQGSTGQMVQMKNAVGDLMEVVGEVIAEAILPFVKRIKEMAQVAQTVDASVIKLAVTIGALVASIGPALIIIGQLVKALGLVLTPIFAKIAAIVAIVAAITYVSKNLSAFADFFQRRFVMIRNSLVIQVAAMIDALDRFVSYLPGVNGALRGVRDSVLEMVTPIPEVENEFQSAGEFITSVAGDIGDAFKWLSETIFPDSTTEKIESARMSIGTAKIQTDELSRSFERASETGNVMESMFARLEARINRQTQVSNFAMGVANDFTSSFGQGMANVVVQGEKLVDTLKNIGKLLASAVIQKGLQVLLTGGLGGTGFFGAAGGLFGKIFGVNDALITSGGDVVKFHPDDNILAMKDFSGIGGGGSQRVEVFGTIRGEDIFVSSIRGGKTYER